MKTVLVPLAPGFEEIETITVVDILRRAGAQVTLAGTEEGPLKGSRGIYRMTCLQMFYKRSLTWLFCQEGNPEPTTLKRMPELPNC